MVTRLARKRMGHRILETTTGGRSHKGLFLRRLAPLPGHADDGSSMLRSRVPERARVDADEAFHSVGGSDPERDVGARIGSVRPVDSSLVLTVDSDGFTLEKDLKHRDAMGAGTQPVRPWAGLTRSRPDPWRVPALGSDATGRSRRPVERGELVMMIKKAVVGAILCAVMLGAVSAPASAAPSPCGEAHGAVASENGNFGWLGALGGAAGYHGAVGQEPGATGYNNSHTNCQA